MKKLFLLQSTSLKKAASIILFVVGMLGVQAQNTSSNYFTLEAFIQQVKKYHPVARQADLLPEKASADLQTARGAFDPLLTLDGSRKTFDGKNYYYYSSPAISLPLPIGNVQYGMENNGGSLISSEVTTGQTSYVGFNIPLARGLMIDKRRAALQQAKIFRNQSNFERTLQINNLLLDAYTAFFSWAGSYQLYKVYENFTAVAAERLRLVRIAYQNGDRAAMDTIEAYAQVTSYQLMQNEALLNWNNSTLELSAYLWMENDINAELPQNTFPSSASLTLRPGVETADELIGQSRLQNPALKIYDFKLSSLEVERRLKRQDFLPYISLKANLLNRDYFAMKGISRGFIENNYKWGVDFQFPLFLRQARGGYKAAQLKIRETELELVYKRQQTENKIRSSYNEISALSQQLENVKTMLANYRSLFRNEELKFSQGESSLFLVNSREVKVIETLQKQIELTVKFQKARYAVLWAAGVIQ